MQQFAPLIQAVCQAVHNPAAAVALEPTLAGMEKHGWTNLVAAIRNIFVGERNAETLDDPLDLDDSMIIGPSCNTCSRPTSVPRTTDLSFQDA